MALDALDDMAGNFLEDRIGDRSGRRGPSHDDRYRLKALDFRRFQETANLMMSVSPFVDQVGAKHQTLSLKSGAIGDHRVEGVGFMHETGDGNAHWISQVSGR